MPHFDLGVLSLLVPVLMRLVVRPRRFYINTSSSLIPALTFSPALMRQSLQVQLWSHQAQPLTSTNLFVVRVVHSTKESVGLRLNLSRSLNRSSLRSRL